MTAQLLEELKQVSKDLLHSTEADYQIEPFVWEVAEKGELTLDKLLHSQGFLRQVEIEQVFPQNLKFFQNALSDEEQAVDHKQLEVINFLRSRCKSLEVYLAQKNDGSDTVETEFEEFPLILAETEAGDWIGIAPEANAEFETRLDAERLVTSYDPHLEQRIWQSAFWKLENVAPPNRADFYVRFDLESLLRNSGAPIFSYATNASRLMDFLARDENVEELLEYHACQRAQMSESTVFLTEEIKKCLVGMKLFTRQFYEPHQAVDRFVMRAAASKEILIFNLVDAIGFSRVCQFIKFSQEAKLYDEDPEDERYTGLEPLDQLLVSSLSNLREYVVGCASVFYLYNVGQNSDGDWVGVSTTAVWT